MLDFTLQGAHELDRLIGCDIAVDATVHIDQDLVDRFGEITKDQQWIHCDAERAAAGGPFGAAVAQGMCTLSFLPFFVRNALYVPGVKFGLGCELTHVRFTRAVPVGSVLSARIRLLRVVHETKWVQATWKISLFANAAIAPSCLAEWTVRYVTEDDKPHLSLQDENCD